MRKNFNAQKYNDRMEKLWNKCMEAKKKVFKASKVFRVYIDIVAEDENSAFACADENASEELRERGSLADSDCFKIFEIKQGKE